VLLDPPEPGGGVHFRLAELVAPARRTGRQTPRVAALEEAPRYRDAHRLLLEINGDLPGAKEAAGSPALDGKR